MWLEVVALFCLIWYITVLIVCAVGYIQMYCLYSVSTHIKD